MLGSAARYESEHKAERHRRKALELARDGKLGGGGSRPFGFEADFKTLQPDEAMILRSLVARFLDGESMARWSAGSTRSTSNVYWSQMDSYQPSPHTPVGPYQRPARTPRRDRSK